MNTSSIAHSDPQNRGFDPDQITGRVYVASSLHTFDTPRYDHEIERIRDHFPHADILPARDQFASNEDWKHNWPNLLLTLQAVVVFPDNDGWVGRGVRAEMEGAIRSGIPIWFLDRDGILHDPHSAQIVIDEDDWRQHLALVFLSPSETKGGV